MKKTIYLVFIFCLLFSLITGAAYAAGGFDDVGENEWFFSGVKYVSTNKILQGVTDNVFEPNAAIDRSKYYQVPHQYLPRFDLNGSVPAAAKLAPDNQK